MHKYEVRKSEKKIPSRKKIFQKVEENVLLLPAEQQYSTKK